jgi:uncharacterized iron-regulated membrane protein
MPKHSLPSIHSTDRRHRRRFHAVLGASALGFLGALTVTTAPVGAAPLAAVTQEDVKGYPSLAVTDITTGKAVNLSKFNTTKVPTLAWFWAPH